MKVGEGPDNPVRRQAVADLRIGVDGLVIIVIDERMAERLAEDQSDRQHQKTAHGEQLAAVPRPRL